MWLKQTIFEFHVNAKKKNVFSFIMLDRFIVRCLRSMISECIFSAKYILTSYCMQGYFHPCFFFACLYLHMLSLHLEVAQTKL